MQAILEIDDDMLRAVTELARNGLSVGKRPLSDFGSGEVRNGVRMFPTRGEVITLEHVQRLIESEGV